MTAALTPEQVDERTRSWTPAKKRALTCHLETAVKRQQIVSNVRDAAELAASCDPDYVRTPAVDLVARSVERVLREPGRNLLVTAPPQELKSTLCAVWTPLRALQLHPDWRIMVLTYADDLAEEHSATAREFISRCGSNAVDDLTGEPVEDKLGISLRGDRYAVRRWRIREGKGGVVAAGINGTITGRSADLIIIDDPFKNMLEADSETHRVRVLNLYRAVIKTRLAPGGRVIMIQTRWHEKDLAGFIIDSEAALPPHQRTWRYLNIPAVAEAHIPDALKREPGTYLESARGRTPKEFDERRRELGERIWYALYQGAPTPPSGGLFERAWFNTHRLTVAPERTAMRIVAIDPSESGKGDDAGIIGASVIENGHALLTHDRSGPMTSDQWARTGVDLAIEIWASEIVVEAFTVGDTYTRVVREEISRRLQDAQVLYERFVKAREHTAAREQIRLINYLSAVRVRKWRMTGDAVARSALLRQGIETGTTRTLAGEMSTFEEQAVTWQVGQHQPDRVAAGVIADYRIREITGRSTDIASPIKAKDNAANRPRREWLARKVG